MAFDTAGAEGTGSDRGRDGSAVAGVADRDIIALGHGRDGTEVQLLVFGWIGAGGMHQDEVFLAEDVDGMVDLGVGAYAGRSDPRLAGLADVPKEMVVAERG